MGLASAAIRLGSAWRNLAIDLLDATIDRQVCDAETLHQLATLNDRKIAAAKAIDNLRDDLGYSIWPLGTVWKEVEEGPTVVVVKVVGDLYGDSEVMVTTERADGSQSEIDLLSLFCWHQQEPETR